MMSLDECREIAGTDRPVVYRDPYGNPQTGVITSAAGLLAYFRREGAAFSRPVNPAHLEGLER